MQENLRHSTFRAAGLIGVFTLLSRIVGLYRDRFFAATFGVGDTLDSYNAAFKIPDLVFNILILGTLSVAFIPVFTEYFVKDKEEASKIANAILTLTFFIMGGICLILLLFVPGLTHLIAPGFSGQKYLNTVVLTRIFLFSPLIFTISSVFGSVLNSLKRFFVISLAPIIYNLGIILGAKFLYPRYGLSGLGYGVILGALAHLLIQVIGALNAGFKIRPNLNFGHLGVRKIGRLFLPRMFGMDQAQFSLIVASIVGSTLASGSITIFTFANNLQAVPLGIFALSFAAASFPVLSEKFSVGDEEGFGNALSKNTLNILYFIVPLSILIIVIRAQIVRVVLGSGNFDWQATRMTANALGIFAASMFAQSLIPLFSRAFYARHNTITPVIVGFFALVVNGLSSYYFGHKYGVTGLTAAFGIASVLNMLMLLFYLKREVVHLGSRNFASDVVKIIFVSLASAALAYTTLYIVQLYIPLTTGINVLLQGVCATAAWFVGFVLLSKILGLKQLELFWGVVKRRVIG